MSKEHIASLSKVEYKNFIKEKGPKYSFLQSWTNSKPPHKGPKQLLYRYGQASRVFDQQTFQ